MKAKDLAELLLKYPEAEVTNLLNNKPIVGLIYEDDGFNGPRVCPCTENQYSRYDEDYEHGFKVTSDTEVPKSNEEYIVFANKVATVLGIHDWIALDERYGDMVRDMFEEGMSVAEAVQACRDDDYEYSDEYANQRMKRLEGDSE